MTTVPGSKRSTSTLRSDTVRLEGSTIQMAGWRSLLVSALAGTAMPVADSISMRPVTVAPSRMAAGGSLRVTLTLNVRVIGIGLRIDLPHAALRRHGRIVGQGDHDIGIGRRRPYHLGRNVEHGVPSLLPGDLENHLSGLHHLARLGASGDDCSGDVRLELSVSDAVLRDLQLRMSVIDPRL